MSQQINFYNPVFLAQKKVFSSRTMMIGLGVVVAALAIVHTAQRTQLVGLQRQAAAADAQFSEAQQQLARFAAQNRRAPSKVLEDEIARLESRRKSQDTLLESFAAGSLGNTEGFARYLSALARQTVDGVWLTGFTANGTDGPSQIRGRLRHADLLPGYLGNLNREETLRGRGFAELRVQAVETRSEGGRNDRTGGVAGHVAGDFAGDFVEFTLGPKRTPSGAGR